MDFISPFNRRVAPRYSNNFPIGIELNGSTGEFCQSRSLNISNTGLRMVVDQALGEGRRLSLTLCLDDDFLVEVEGHTVWQECLGTMGTHVIGVEFRPNQIEAEDRIDCWLRSRGQAA